MTEQEYDEQIAPALAELAQKVQKMGGSMVARVEWARDESGITHIGVTDESGVGQRLTQIAALCRGNLDTLFIQARRRFDLSQTLVGHLLDKHNVAQDAQTERTI